MWIGRGESGGEDVVETTPGEDPDEWKECSGPGESSARNAGGLMLSMGDDASVWFERDEMPAPQEPSLPEHGRVLRLGVAHAPYRRVLDSFVEDGSDLILAGHTHGGQLRIPGFGALVTNCDLPRAQARGLSTWRGVPLNVSAGMGASPYSNYRFATPPEASLITLRAPLAGSPDQR